MRTLGSAALLACSAFLLGSCSSPKEPDTALREVIQDVAKGRVSTLWFALPKSYRNDLMSVIRDATKKLDPEIYNEAFKLARQFVQSARDKPGILGDLLPAGYQGVKIDFDKNAKLLFGLFEKVTSGDVSTVEGLQQLNPAVLLDQVGGVFARLAESTAREQGKTIEGILDGLTMKVAKREGDEATLEFLSTELPMAIPLPLRLVEGRWIPVAMADGWADAMKKLREHVAKLPDMHDPQVKREMKAELSNARAQLQMFFRPETGEGLDPHAGKPSEPGKPSKPSK